MGEGTTFQPRTGAAGQATDGSEPTRRPLEGIRVVEVGVWHAGPGAGALLTDLGADVIKVEPPAGNPERISGMFGPMRREREVIEIPGSNTLFELSNRNKRGIALDLRTESGREILRRMLVDADVLLTNLRNETRPKLGIDYESVRAINPDIVHVGVSGYGRHGDYADVGGFDPLGQAVSGIMYLAGASEPKLLQMIVLDQLTALMGCFATVTALLTRERHGGAVEANTSLYASATFLTAMNLMAASLMPQMPDLRWDRSRNPPLRNTYRCNDDKWIMSCNHPDQKYWARFCQVIGHPELEHDPRFETTDLRIANGTALVEALDAAMLAHDSTTWLRLFREAGVLCAPVQDFPDVLNDLQAQVNGYIVDFQHPVLGPVKMPGHPVEYTGFTTRQRSAAPAVGEHTREIMRELGFGADEVDQYIADGVLAAAGPTQPVPTQPVPAHAAARP